MVKRRWIYGACFAAVLLLGMSATPRYLEELRVGGGYGDADGGLDIEADGSLSTDGDVLVEGGVTVRGRVTAGSGGHLITTGEGLLDGAKLADGSVGDAKVSDDITVGSGGSVAGSAIDIPAAPNETEADDADTLLIHDASAGATREMSRQDFLTGLSGGEELWTDAGGFIQPNNAPGVHIHDDGGVVVPGTLDVADRVSFGTATGDTYLVKARFEGSDTLGYTDRTALEGHVVWSGGPHTMSNLHGIVGRASVGPGYSASATDVVGVRGLALTGPSFTQIGRGIGVKGQVALTQTGNLVDGMALYAGMAGSSGSVANLYGLYVEDVTQGTAANHAIYTGLGPCRFGDDVTVAGSLALEGGAIATPGGLAVSVNSGLGGLAVSAENISVTASQLRQEGELLVRSNAQPLLRLSRTGTPVAGTALGEMTYRGLNAASSPVSYAAVRAKVLDITAGSESGQLEIGVLDNGAQATALRFDGVDASFAGNLSVAGSLSTPTLVTFTPDDTTPSVAGANVFRVPDTWTSGNGVTHLDDGAPGQIVTILGGDADCVFADNAYLHLAGPWTAHPGDTLVLVYAENAWHEISRSDN